jgi:hypothetical protein
MNSRGSSCNDPDKWALTSALHVPWESIVDEDPFETFHLPFDLCLELARGNKNIARYLYYRYSGLRS